MYSASQVASPHKPSILHCCACAWRSCVKADVTAWIGGLGPGTIIRVFSGGFTGCQPNVSGAMGMPRLPVCVYTDERVMYEKSPLNIKSINVAAQCGQKESVVIHHSPVYGVLKIYYFEGAGARVWLGGSAQTGVCA